MSTTADRARVRAKAFAERTEMSGRLVAPVDVHNVSTYKNRGCRCEACKAANRAQMAADRARRHKTTADIGGIAPTDKHNACTYSNWGCRCADCVAAWNATARKRLRRRAAKRKAVNL